MAHTKTNNQQLVEKIKEEFDHLIVWSNDNDDQGLIWQFMEQSLLQMQKETGNCKVCKYIKTEGFPFFTLNSKYFIDTEGCAKEDYLQIYYCPKCGKKLQSLKK